MTIRITCCIVHCHHTTGQAKYTSCDEWICQKHWVMVPKRLKWLKRRFETRFKKFPTKWNGAACDRIWQKCKASVYA